ncbi:MAG: dienelactone hydrolase family protein [Bacteroidetes bacterium]|nr:dienelactone hydrolase family protein [Bacteroidota bacterium]
MKRLLLTFTLLSLFSLSNTWAQTDCCEVTAADVLSFSEFANDEKFISSHLSPLPLDFEPKVGKMVSMKTDGGKEFAVFEVKSGKTNGALILMFHEWWGLNDYILREAEKLHIATGATVLAVDLYDRKVATNAEEAAKLMKSVEKERVEGIIKACIDYGGKFSRIQTIGWCMGGGWVYKRLFWQDNKVMAVSFTMECRNWKRKNWRYWVDLFLVYMLPRMPGLPLSLWMSLMKI